MRLQNFEGGGGGQTRYIMGDVQMVNSLACEQALCLGNKIANSSPHDQRPVQQAMNSHTSQYSLVPGLSLANHKI